MNTTADKRNRSPVARVSCMLDSLEIYLHRLCTRSRFFTRKNWQYCCLLSGQLSFLCAFMVLVAAGFLPPMKPTWSAERVHEHYFSHKEGVRASVPLLLLSGGFYLPFSALLSKHLRQIPGVDPILPDLQLAAGAASIFSIMVPASFLGLITFRDYGPELTLLISDQFWLNFFLPWPTFLIQAWTVAWAAFADTSAKPVFSKTVGLINFVVPFFYLSLTGVHVQHEGPYAWSGALTFWVAAVAFGVQIGADTNCLFQRIRAMPDDDCAIEEEEEEAQGIAGP
ncbi:hypothetical protein N7471_013924 [Penicillium samsonianum]|uniref:uncharacterized protein n=1 Tax=Penicillium samsonianum TaxID=1882272 RepID=UPI0025499CA3|nr:uncharacterized protein N7471_013924 [Penicillium samsonianum]KAJ6118047.1 hypothetical protein N7471_013924 [Penicillium samsonianum]